MMKQARVGVVGYGAIGQRLADAVYLQEDMELVGISDVAPTLSIKALFESGMDYDLYLSSQEHLEEFENLGIPVAGSLEELVQRSGIILDASPAGIGIKNKKIYEKYAVPAIFQGGESNEVADVFFHGTANYDKGIGQEYLKLTSCNTTGLIRTVNVLNEMFDVHDVAITIIRRFSDPGDYHRGLTNALQIEPAPSHQAVDLMKILPSVQATGVLVHTPVTHGHIITVIAKGASKMTKETVVAAFESEQRIRVVSTKEGFLGNASFFKYARDLGNKRGDMYEVGIWEDSITPFEDGIMYAINIPQESVTIPETIDAIRAALKMQTVKDDGVRLTNQYLKIGVKSYACRK